MHDDDSMLGQNEIDVRNEARREYQHGGHFHMLEQETLFEHHEQIVLCTNDERCQAAVDEHDPHCPVEDRLREEFGF